MFNSPLFLSPGASALRAHHIRLIKLCILTKLMLAVAPATPTSQPLTIIGHASFNGCVAGPHRRLLQSGTCTYSVARNTVTCNGITCRTANPSQLKVDPLPQGNYLIGATNVRRKNTVYWFDLFPETTVAGRQAVWDYHTRVPQFQCRGGFGFHTGTKSAGCVTVEETDCMKRMLAPFDWRMSWKRDRIECGGCRNLPLVGSTCLTGVGKLDPVNIIARMVSA
jgi:hypothetical protein